MARRITAFAAGLVFVLMACTIDAQERFGSVAGTVLDSSGAAVPGATVTTANKETGATQVTVSGPDGTYRVPDLDPGRYSITIELQGFQKVVVDNLIVLLGRTLTADAKLQPGVLSEIVSVTADATQQLDLASVTLAHNVTAEEFDRLPKGRSFQSIALAAPGVNSGEIEGGFQVNGASSAENVFTVDGVATNSLIYGSSRQNTVFEYLQEVQVKTGGIDAEYGGALGGVISAVTKSGGNLFAGEGHYYYIGNALSAGPVKRLVLDPNDLTTVGYFQDDKQANNQSEFGGSIGGPIVRDRLFFFGSVSPRVVRRTNDYMFSSGTEPGTIDQDQTAWQGFGKVTYSAGRLHANASVLMTPTRSTGRLPAYDSTGTNYLITTSRGQRGEPHARVRERSEQRRRQRRPVADQQCVSDSPRRLLLRQLQGHGRAAHDELHVSDPQLHRAGSATEPAGPGEHGKHPAHPDHATSTRRRRDSFSSITTMPSRAPAPTSSRAAGAFAAR